jgi:hypothetical protein
MQYTMDMFGLSPSSSSSYSSSGYTASSIDMFDTSTMGWSGFIGYTIAILLVLLVLLAFIHYTITPIFQLQPGGPGYIRIPFMDSSEKYWPPSSVPYTVPDISNCAVNNAYLASNWSMSLDICIMNPQQRIMVADKSAFRLIFNRGGSPPSTFTGDGSITSVWTGYNLAVGILKDTNDLLVSVMNGKGNPENIFIANVPTQQPFRLGVVVMDNAFEVYINGKLAKTRKLVTAIPALSSTAPPPLFQGPQGATMNQVARVGNLLLWTQIVSPSVMKYATPALMATVPGMDNLTAAAGSCGSTNPGDSIGSLFADYMGDSLGGLSDLKVLEQTAKTQNVQSALTSLGTSAQDSTSLISANSVINNPRRQ